MHLLHHQSSMLGCYSPGATPSPPSGPSGRGCARGSPPRCRSSGLPAAAGSNTAEAAEKRGCPRARHPRSSGTAVRWWSLLRPRRCSSGRGRWCRVRTLSPPPAQASFPTVCTHWRVELACHVIKSGKKRSKFIITILNMANEKVPLVRMTKI